MVLSNLAWHLHHGESHGHGFFWDGRSSSLREQVLDHYDHGAVSSTSLDPMMQYNVDYGLGLSEQDRADLIAFLHTLTDTEFLNNPAFANPH